jgi:CubicO group peptidase (beta-lactamase class C family)
MQDTMPLVAHMASRTLRRVFCSPCGWALRQALCATVALGLAASAMAQARSIDAQWLDKSVGAKVSQGGPPGAAAVVVRADGTQTLRAWGTQGGMGTAPVDAETTVFRVGSITKTFTALAVLQLVDEGRVALDDDVNQHLKGVRVCHTVRRCACATCWATEPAWTATSPSRAWTTRKQPHRPATLPCSATSTPCVHPAGCRLTTTWPSGCWGTCWSRWTVFPMHKAVQRRILQPLGMLHTRVGLPTQAEHTARRV